MPRIFSKEKQTSLERARDAFKLGGKFDTTRNEVLFASRALIVEGYGDRIASVIIAEKLGFNLDAEGIAIVDCGGKAGIELVIRVCSALEIPFVVLHDEDVWPVEADDERQQKQEKENKEEQDRNRKIRDAVGNDDNLFVLKPSLEAVLTISREAKDKPRRIAETLVEIDLRQLPPGLDPLLEAVLTLMQCTEEGNRTS